MTLDELISRTLLLDLETTKTGRIRHIGAVFNDQVFETNSESSLKQILSHVEALASVADFVLGHNLLGHDFPVLQSTYPQLAILKKPVQEGFRDRVRAEKWEVPVLEVVFV